MSARQRRERVLESNGWTTIASKPSKSKSGQKISALLRAHRDEPNHDDNIHVSETSFEECMKRFMRTHEALLKATCCDSLRNLVSIVAASMNGVAVKKCVCLALGSLSEVR